MPLGGSVLTKTSGYCGIVLPTARSVVNMTFVSPDCRTVLGFEQTAPDWCGHRRGRYLLGQLLPSGKQKAAGEEMPGTKASTGPWRISLIGGREQFLSYVNAPNGEVAEAAAVAAFSLTEQQCKRLVVEKLGS